MPSIVTANHSNSLTDALYATLSNSAAVAFFDCRDARMMVASVPRAVRPRRSRQAKTHLPHSGVPCFVSPPSQRNLDTGRLRAGSLSLQGRCPSSEPKTFQRSTARSTMLRSCRRSSRHCRAVDAVCLFPEGASRFHPTIAPLKTGGASVGSAYGAGVLMLRLHVCSGEAGVRCADAPAGRPGFQGVYPACVCHVHVSW